ncbi:hypothetical protein COCNU_03G014950 [Cocos nucifera]|uniref:glycylpeptide N-tetradecanoyltransferase n=1 Tax=Cocos nucifera TaxID=13894 RepID=A0A8K0I4S5_COCNU|nr:hypothetical protein COCNU_03G014950 [Cocos nucifera]
MPRRGQAETTPSGLSPREELITAMSTALTMCLILSLGIFVSELVSSNEDLWTLLMKLAITILVLLFFTSASILLMWAQIRAAAIFPTVHSAEDLGFPTIPATTAPSSSNGNKTPNPSSIPTPDPEGSSVEDLRLRIRESLALPNRHHFWETQPVGQFKDLGDTSLPEGPIEPPSRLFAVRPDPYNLPALFEWSTVDVDNAAACAEVYHLLSLNYVEDDENFFRFNYSQPFLRWVLRPPGFFKAWHIGVRVKASKKLVAFIAAVPARIRVRDAVVRMAEVNFLCVHKKLRSKRLALVLIKEVTRRVHLEGTWQAAYTAEAVIPTPVATCQCWHRPLNPKKLIDVGFSRLGDRMTMSRTIRPPDSAATPGLWKMELRDVPAVPRLLRGISAGSPLPMTSMRTMWSIGFFRGRTWWIAIWWRAPGRHRLL